MHTLDNMLSTVLRKFNVYIKNFLSILRSDILHHSAILPEKDKLFITYIFKQVHFEMMNSFCLYVCVCILMCLWSPEHNVKVFLNCRPLCF